MDIDAELTDWIPDTGSSKSQKTNYYHTIDLYWHVKALLGKVMADRQAGNNEISLRLEYL